MFDVYYLPMVYKQDIEGEQENLVKLGGAFVRRFNSLVNTYIRLHERFILLHGNARSVNVKGNVLIIDMKEKPVFAADLLNELILLL